MKKLLLFLVLGSCSTYQDSVSSRSVGAGISPDSAKIVYTVTYR